MDPPASPIWEDPAVSAVNKRPARAVGAVRDARACRPATILSLGAARMGLGGASCGPRPLDRYILNPGPFRFRFVLRPHRPGEERRPAPPAGERPRGGSAS